MRGGRGDKGDPRSQNSLRKGMKTGLYSFTWSPWIRSQAVLDGYCRKCARGCWRVGKRLGGGEGLACIPPTCLLTQWGSSSLQQ